MCYRVLQGDCPVARIYTKTGDNGTTGLIGGKRVPKDSPVTETVGSLDELNAWLGLVRSLRLPDNIDQSIRCVQEDLFLISAELATPEGAVPRSRGIGDEEIRRVEREIDTLEGNLKPLKQFILPGGSPEGAYLHLTRAVARRAERQCVALSRIGPVNPQILQYMNRLSDLCFVLARYANSLKSMPESHPTFGKSL
jgi:cob(I)alamin adenosyltransferase